MLPTMSTTTTTRATALMLAALAGCDWRTARRALDEGVDVIRVERVRVDIQRAAETLGIALPHREEPAA